jgi:hypothetical protein
MKKLVIPAFAAGVLLLAGCDKSSPVTSATGTPMPVTDWGVVEVAASTPKHLKLEGKDCTLTATPLANGNFAVLIEGDFDIADKDSPPGLPAGTRIHTHTTQNMIVPGNVECNCAVGHRPVRFTLKLKTS